MSLDLSGKSGRAHNTAPFSVSAGGSLAAIVAATFDSGDFDNAGSLLLQLDTTTAGADLNTLPTSLLDSTGAEALTDGVRINVVKVTSDPNKLTFTDPITGIAYAYVGTRGESMTLAIDTSTGTARWVTDI